MGVKKHKKSTVKKKRRKMLAKRAANEMQAGQSNQAARKVAMTNER